MEGILIYNYYEGSDPEDFYKAWFRDPVGSYYPTDNSKWTYHLEGLFISDEFTLGGPKLLIKW